MRRRLSIESRKEEIILAALKAFARDGLGKTSLRSIAKEAQSSAGLLLHHFEDLDHLFLEVAKHVVQMGRKTSESYFLGLKDAEPILRAYSNSMFDWLGLKQEYQAIILQLYHYAIYNDKFNSLNVEVVKGGRKRIRSILQQGCEEDVFRIDDLDMTTKAIQDLLTGTFFRMAATRGLYNPQIERDQLYQEIKALVGIGSL